MNGEMKKTNSQEYINSPIMTGEFNNIDIHQSNGMTAATNS